MKLHRVVLSILFVTVTVIAQAQVKKVIADKIVGAVGDKYILKSDIDNAIADYKRQAQGQEGAVIPSVCQVLEGQLIRKALVLQSEKDSLVVTDEEVENMIDTKIRRFIAEFGSKEALEEIAGKSIVECNAMVAAQEKYGRAVQAGQWQRSQQHFGDAVNFVHTGKLGAIRNVKVWCYSQSTPMQPKADAPIPAGVDYKTWLGPAQLRPYNRNRFHYSFRWFWDYAGGLMTDWGVHLLDYALLGMKKTAPNTISAVGGKYADPNAASETPDMLNVLYGFDKFSVSWEQTMGITNGNYGRDHGVAFQGDNGTLILNRNGWEVIEESRSANKIIVPLNRSVDNGVEKHWINFLEVVKSRDFSKLHCSIQEGAKVATICQMGNIAHRSGKQLQWDSTKKQFTDAAVNAKYLSAVYHNGYSIPKI